MLRQSIKNIIKACGGKVLQEGSMEFIEGLSTDSRTIKKNSLFIPLVGEKFDGHQFIEVAKKRGAIATLCEKGKYIDLKNLTDIYIIEVDNTLDSLQAISKYYRNLFNIPFIAITGSTGKTSTKDIITSVLSQKYNTLKNKGNLNNHIGLPLTIFNLDNYNEMAILEMGMSNFGEILDLTEIVRPHISVITNIGLSHIEHLGSRENIMKAKMEITTYLKEEDYLLLNGDDELLVGLKNMKSIYKKIFFGLSQENDIYPKNLIDLGEEGFTFDIEINGEDYPFTIKQPGIHNIYNALVAIWIGVYRKLTIEEIEDGLESYIPSKMRMEILEEKDIKIVNDAYNASPDSMKAALSVLKGMKGNTKIAVLGNMLELGDFSKEGHRIVGEYSGDKVDILITIGDEARWIAEGARVKGLVKQIHITNSNKEAVQILDNILDKNDIVLIKGSRGMKMEEIVEYLQERS